MQTLVFPTTPLLKQLGGSTTEPGGLLPSDVPREQVQQSDQFDDCSEEETEDDDHREPESSHNAKYEEAKEDEETDEEEAERTKSYSNSGSEGGLLEDATIEEECPGLLTMLQLPGFPGTVTEPDEPNISLEMLPHNFLANQATDEVPSGPDRAMDSFECNGSCHLDLDFCLCSNKRSKK